jgi:SAM-dependent methyltransferase
MERDTVIADLFERLERERQLADQKYNDALTALDRAIQSVPELRAAPIFHDRSAIERLNAGWKVAPSEEPPAGGSLKTRLRRFIWRVVAPTLEAQQRFNAALVEHINRNIAAHEEATRAASALVAEARDQMEALVRFESLLLQFLQTITGYVDTKDRSAGGPEIREQLGLVHQRLVMVERDLGRALDRRPAGDTDRSAPPTTAPPQAEMGAVVYLGFEDRFRGATTEIRGRVESYLPLFATASDVLDIGCGRGELLELLRDRGVTARGVDTNQAMVDACRAKGLQVEREDAALFLERQRDASLGGVVAIQVVEHFEPAYLIRVLDLAYRKMRPGAPLVLETINPACWMAFFECYIRDLTHARPLHPDTLRYLVQASGFTAVNIEYRQPVGDTDRLDRVAAAAADPSIAALAAVVNAHADKLNARLFSAMDYAVIARR